MYVLKFYLGYITNNIYMCAYKLCMCIYIIHILNLDINISNLKKNI